LDMLAELETALYDITGFPSRMRQLLIELKRDPDDAVHRVQEQIENTERNLADASEKIFAAREMAETWLEDTSKEEEVRASESEREASAEALRERATLAIESTRSMVEEIENRVDGLDAVIHPFAEYSDGPKASMTG